MAENCICCSDELGAGSVGAQVPFRVPDDQGEGGGKVEVWCPQCFVHVRAPMEPARFPTRATHPNLKGGGYQAIRCFWPTCGLISVDTGRGVCMHCRSRAVMVLAPKNPDAAMAWVATQKKAADRDAERTAKLTST